MRFLMATDGSEGSRAAADFLRNLPLTAEDSIALLTVIQTEESKSEANRILDEAKNWLGPTPATLHRYIRQGNAALEIIDTIIWMAEEVPTDLVVMGTHGRTGIARFFLGSVAERVARFGNAPVVVANHVKGPLKTIVIGYDGSRGARRCVSFVDNLPLTPDCEICVVTIVTPLSAVRSFLPEALQDDVEEACEEERQTAREALAEIRRTLEARGRRVTTILREGDAASALLKIAEERHADLIAVGAQGMSEVEQFLMGSVSDKVLRHAPGSVLVVRPLPGRD